MAGWGAPVKPEERETIIDFLLSHFGPHSAESRRHSPRVPISGREQLHQTVHQLSNYLLPPLRMSSVNSGHINLRPRKASRLILTPSGTTTSRGYRGSAPHWEAIHPRMLAASGRKITWHRDMTIEDPGKYGLTPSTWH
jgi:hypothetical protein